MTKPRYITTKHIKELTGFKISWISKHFNSTAEDYIADRHCIFNVNKLIAVAKHRKEHNTFCRNPVTMQRSIDMFDKLIKELECLKS
jgi:hypothetical protein